MNEVAKISKIKVEFQLRISLFIFQITQSFMYELQKGFMFISSKIETNSSLSQEHLWIFTVPEITSMTSDQVILLTLKTHTLFIKVFT